LQPPRPHVLASSVSILQIEDEKTDTAGKEEEVIGRGEKKLGLKISSLGVGWRISLVYLFLSLSYSL
jgi:hypothetical protein